MHRISIKLLFIIIAFFMFLFLTNIFNYNVKASSNPSIKYTTYVQKQKWQPWVTDKMTSGKKNKGLNIEGLKIKLNGLSGVNLKYKVYVQNTGWQGWRENGAEAGKPGKKRIEAIRIHLQDTDEYSVQYRVYLKNKGWQSWKSDGAIAGKIGKKIYAIQIKIVAKIIKTKTNIETSINGNTYYSNTSILSVSGWKMTNTSNTSIKTFIDDKEMEDIKINYLKRSDVINEICGYGTSTQNKKPGFNFDIQMNELTEGTHILKIKIYKEDKRLRTTSLSFTIDRKLHVTYRTNILDYGTSNYVMDGNTSGKIGKGKRMKSLNIKLINKEATSGIKYRIFSEGTWQAWKENNGKALASGKKPQIEKIQIKLINLDAKTAKYRVYIENKGWTSWSIDGETCRKKRQKNRSNSSKNSNTLQKRI